MLTILSTEDAQDTEFRSFFGRIQDAIICFRDLLTFTHLKTVCINFNKGRKRISAPGISYLFLFKIGLELGLQAALAYELAQYMSIVVSFSVWMENGPILLFQNRQKLFKNLRLQEQDFRKTSPKGVSASKCDVGNWIFSKS